MTPTQRLLCRLARIHLSDEDQDLARHDLRQVDWEELFRLANRGGIAGLVIRHLVGRDLGDRALPGEVLHRFVAVSLIDRTKNQILMAQAQALCARAEAEDLVLIPLKGAALCLGRPYADLSLRSMCDLDLLARPDQLPALERLLQAHGYHDISDRGYALRHLHHLTYDREVDGTHVMIELHWTPLLTMWSDARHERLIIERSRTEDHQGAAIRVLAPEDMLLTVILHLAAHRYRAQLKWLVDVAELARCQPIDWERLWRLARDLGAYRAVYFACHLARELLEAPVVLPARQPLLHPLLTLVSPAESIVTSQPQPGWTSRTLINLLQFDAPAGGLRFLRRKGGELKERYGG